MTLKDEFKLLVSVTTMSGRMFQIPALFSNLDYAVIPTMNFYETEAIAIPGCYTVTHVNTGQGIAIFRNKQYARGFCKWLRQHLAGYTPSNPDHEAKRLTMKQDIENVCRSFKGRMLS